MRARRIVRALFLVVVTSLSSACASSSISPSPATASPVATPSATPGPSVTPIRNAKDLMTAKEAGDLMGDTIKRAAPGKIDLRVGRLNGWSFTGERYPTQVIVGIAPADGTRTDVCKPAAKCPTFDKVKKAQPKGVESFTGIGDDAFGVWQQGQGHPPILMGARKGAIAVYLWVDTSVYERLRNLLSVLVARI